MDEKQQMIAEWQSGQYTKAALARRYRVSRTTLYKWIERYEQAGLEGLAELSRAPRRQARKTSPEVVEQIVALRTKLPLRGAGKLKALWEQQPGRERWPARSTVAGILQQHGLTRDRRRRRRVPPSLNALSAADGPNRLWCADFKGWFPAGDGSRCEPLTICDASSRYLLCCQLVPSTAANWVRPLFEMVFREYGLPQAIRTDNGPPFATTAIAGLSSLSVWWIRLGIRPERIEPGKPQQNGRLERLHQTLKLEAASPAAPTWRLQQRALDCFRDEYNEQRPHEALGQQPPARHYQAATRRYRERLEEIEYPPPYRLRRVSKGGQFTWGPREVYVSKALSGEVIGLEPIDGRRHRVWFGPLELAILDGATGRLGDVAGSSGGALRVAPSAAGNVPGSAPK